MSESLRLVLGFSPGSASDQIARLLAPVLSKELGQAVEVELRPGQNGATAACSVARAAPDGRTLFMATLGTHALAPHLDHGLAYDAQRDFAPVSLVSSAPLVLACHASLNVHTPSALVELARSKPGSLTYGTSAIGGAPHLAAELFQSLTGLKLEHVRYDETERLYDDLAAGRIALTFNNMMSMLPRCASGAIRALAVTTVDRSAAAPELPTLAECGITHYDVANWVGLVAPAGTPASVIDRLATATAAAIHDPGVTQTMHEAGVTPRGSTPLQFADHIARELERWAPVVARFRDDTGERNVSASTAA